MHKGLSTVYAEKRYKPAYSRVFQTMWNSAICDLAGIPGNSRVLDYGCGTGILFPELEKRDYRAIGIDLSMAMLQGRTEPTSVTSICADGTNTPFADGQFDAVFCRGSIHHLPDIRKAFAEIHRVLKTGGVLVFSEPSNDSILNRLARKVMYRASREFHEEDEGFRRREITPLLEELGFTIEVSRGFGFMAYTFAGFPDKLPLLKYVPGNCTITRWLMKLDAVLEHSPLVADMALHWQLRGRKR